MQGPSRIGPVWNGLGRALGKSTLPFAYHVICILESVSSLLSGNLRCLSFISHQCVVKMCHSSLGAVCRFNQPVTGFLHILRTENPNHVVATYNFPLCTSISCRSFCPVTPPGHLQLLSIRLTEK